MTWVMSRVCGMVPSSHSDSGAGAGAVVLSYRCSACLFVVLVAAGSKDLS